MNKHGKSRLGFSVLSVGAFFQWMGGNPAKPRQVDGPQDPSRKEQVAPA